MDLLQKDVPILTKIYEAKCFYDSQNNRIILYYKNHVTARTLVDFYNLPTTPPPNSSLYVIYDLQTGTFNVSTDPPTYTVSNSKVYVTSPINAEYDMDKVIIYRINWYETDTDYILTQLNTFVRKQQADTITATHTFDPTQPGPAFQLGPNAQNQLIQYLNADKVDGFHASLTPAPNTIVPLNANGILDLSATYVSSDVYTFRRVNLTGATSDYELQVGEEAIINFTNRTSVPLRIETQSGTLYNLYIYLTSPSFAQGNGVVGSAFLLPNNTSYTNAFYRAGAVWNSDGVTGSYSGNISAFEMIGDLYPANCFSIIYNETTHKATTSISIHAGTNTSNYARWQHINCVWNNYTTAWTSLGTITFPTSSSGYILVRRLA